MPWHCRQTVSVVGVDAARPASRFFEAKAGPFICGALPGCTCLCLLRLFRSSLSSLSPTPTEYLQLSFFSSSEQFSWIDKFCDIMESLAQVYAGLSLLNLLVFLLSVLTIGCLIEFLGSDLSMLEQKHNCIESLDRVVAVLMKTYNCCVERQPLSSSTNSSSTTGSLIYLCVCCRFFNWIRCSASGAN